VWAASLNGARPKLSVGTGGIAVESAGRKWLVRVDSDKPEVRVE
jgi:hypothetical protein